MRIKNDDVDRVTLDIMLHRIVVRFECITTSVEKVINYGKCHDHLGLSLSSEERWFGLEPGGDGGPREIRTPDLRHVKATS